VRSKLATLSKWCSHILFGDNSCTAPLLHHATPVVQRLPTTVCSIDTPHNTLCCLPRADNAAASVLHTRGCVGPATMMPTEGSHDILLNLARPLRQPWLTSAGEQHVVRHVSCKLTMHLHGSEQLQRQLARESALATRTAGSRQQVKQPLVHQLVANMADSSAADCNSCWTGG
jgi:hypothetical protein